MVDRWTQTFIPTLRQVPAEAEVVSHRLMLRAGMIHKLAAGSYTYLPLGVRSLAKARRIIREEMNRAGAVEVLMPTLQPIELWERSGRREAYGENLFVLKDRHGRELALGPTHEEVITELVHAHIASYKDLPLTLYQIQTKFRDEFRPRFGVLRSREFLMKDAYSFHLSVEGEGGLNETYDKQYAAYQRIFTRCGLPYETVEAESGPIGGSASHEFMIPAPTGEDVILKSDKGNYAANVEKCEIGERKVGEAFQSASFSREAKRSGPPSTDQASSDKLQKVHTPNCPTIEDVAKFMRAEPKSLLKTLIFKVLFEGDERKNAASQGDKANASVVENHGSNLLGWPASSNRKYIVAVVRGDQEVNEAKLKAVVAELYKNTSSYRSITLAPEQEAREDGFVIGFVGPRIACKEVMVGSHLREMIVDFDASGSQPWIIGADEDNHHRKNFNWHRDFFEALDDGVLPGIALIADIRNAVAGDPSPKNDGGVLQETHGIEIGHIFKLGARYSDAFGFTVLDENNQARQVLMGCYGIGVNRLLAGAIEAEGGHDDRGIVWPVGLAPYSVLITPIKYDGEAKKVVDDLATELEAAGVDVLIDDRDERPGVKFKDADLIGIPVRVTVGDKGLKEGAVEISRRTDEGKGALVKLKEAVGEICAMVAR